MACPTGTPLPNAAALRVDEKILSNLTSLGKIPVSRSPRPAVPVRYVSRMYGERETTAKIIIIICKTAAGDDCKKMAGRDSDNRTTVLHTA